VARFMAFVVLPVPPFLLMKEIILAISQISDLKFQIKN
jgi:hypothetical protein